MTRGDASTVQAAITLTRKAPPRKILHQTGFVTAPGYLVVSCRLQAELTASPYEFNLTPQGWVQRSLLTGQTATWSWFVTPKLGGTHTILVTVRPLVRVQEASDVVHDISNAESSDVQQFATAAHVKVPWTQLPAEVMSQLAANFKVAQGLIEAITGFVLAVVALASALGIRKRRKRTHAPAQA
jgi:hypothetical protein